MKQGFGLIIAGGVLLLFAVGIFRIFAMPRIHNCRIRKALNLDRISVLAKIDAKNIHFKVISYRPVLNAPRGAFRYRVLVEYWDDEHGAFVICPPPRYVSTLGGNYATEETIAKDIIAARPRTVL